MTRSYFPFRIQPSVHFLKCYNTPISYNFSLHGAARTEQSVNTVIQCPCRPPVVTSHCQYQLLRNTIQFNPDLLLSVMGLCVSWLWIIRKAFDMHKVLRRKKTWKVKDPLHQREREHHVTKKEHHVPEERGEGVTYIKWVYIYIYNKRGNFL